MRLHPLLVIGLALLVGSGLAGCFGSDSLNGNGSQSPTTVHEEHLFLSQVMFHPYPGGMLSALQFSRSPDASSFEPPIIRVQEGQKVRVTLTNTDPLNLNHTIHWHGLHVPWEMDGVPYVTQDPIGPGESFTYEFIAGPAGTHWFHCHVDAPHHIDMGMYGVIIVEPKDGEPYDYDREEVLMLDSWDSRHIHQMDMDPEMLLMSLLDGSGDPFNQADRTLFQLREILNDPQYPVLRDYYENPARQQRDWYPETFPPWQPKYDTYTINGMSYPWTKPLEISEGETLKLRLVNMGHSTHAMHIHGHHFKVTHKDGYPLPAAYMADTVLIGPGERYDVLIEGHNPGIWMLHDHVGPHAMNDHIAPGGMKTHLVYDDFHYDHVDDDHAHHLRYMRAGDFLGLYTR
jgi:manganese oxidase